jgi:PPE-repeat protein
MDFAALPPEINSARMHTGPRSAPPWIWGSTTHDLCVADANAESFGIPNPTTPEGAS